MTRDTIYKALFDRLVAKLPGLLYTTRRNIDFDAIGKDRMPALVVLATDERAEHEVGYPQKWSLQATVIVYNVYNEEDAETPLLAYVDAIDDALKLQPGERGNGSTSLGNIVRWARLSSAEVYQASPGEVSGLVCTVEMEYV